MFVFDPDVWPTTVFSLLFPALRTAMIDAAASDDPLASIRSWIAALPPLGDRGSYADILGSDGVERFARSWSKCDAHLLDGIDDIASIDVATWRNHDVETPITCQVLVVRADPQLMPGFRPEDEARFLRFAAHATFGVAEERATTFTRNSRTGSPSTSRRFWPRREATATVPPGAARTALELVSRVQRRCPYAVRRPGGRAVAPCPLPTDQAAAVASARRRSSARAMNVASCARVSGRPGANSRTCRPVATPPAAASLMATSWTEPSSSAK